MQHHARGKIDQLTRGERFRNVIFACLLLCFAIIVGGSYYITKIEPSIQVGLPKKGIVSLYRNEIQVTTGSKVRTIRFLTQNGMVVRIGKSFNDTYLKVGEEVQYAETEGKYTGFRSYTLLSKND